jgi:hypothetical protein
MSTLTPEFEELRLGIERLRGLLENIVARGLRACGSDELLQLQSFTEYLDRAGAGHVASILATLHSQIEKDERASAKTLLNAQISVRLLERLLTLKIVGGQYMAAVDALDRMDRMKALEAGAAGAVSGDDDADGGEDAMDADEDES